MSNIRQFAATAHAPAATAVREPASGYAPGNVTPIRPEALRQPEPADDGRLEQHVRADAVIQALTCAQGIVLADVRPLAEDDVE